MRTAVDLVYLVYLVNLVYLVTQVYQKAWFLTHKTLLFNKPLSLAHLLRFFMLSEQFQLLLPMPSQRERLLT